MAEKKKKTMSAHKQKKHGPIKRVYHRAKALRDRRPHKSFQLTRRRDVPKHPALPGFIAFTASVVKFIKANIRAYGAFLLLYLFVAAMLIGVMQFQQYQSLRELLQSVDPSIVGSQWKALSRGVGMFGTAITGGLNATLSETQQLYLGLLYLIGWLVIIWWLRQRFAENAVRIRDAVYNGCAPFVSTFLVLLLMFVQSLPGVLAVVILSASFQMGLEGVSAMMLAILAALLVLLSLYWLTSSIFALLIVTLPGTFPMAAIRSAGDLAIGRRLPLMLRLIWLVVLLFVVWALVLIPVILLDNWINVSWSPLVPLFVQLLTGVSLLTGSTYVYMLYRRMIDGAAR